MKITCEHCGALIDVENEKKCNNCGAPYANNKQYKEYKRRKDEFDKEHMENKINAEKIVNSIVKNTFTSFQIARIISFFIIIIVFIVFGFILFKGIKNNNPNNFNDRNVSSSTFNFDIEMFKGNQNGFILESLISTVINKNSKYPEHTISIIYNDKTYVLTDELITLKGEISNNKYYEVIFNYKEEFINNIIILNK